ncbi:hypothetical protein HY478_00025 [Candidatus Uhrbacteria bacterium]|nr:hypothetical protein [Candidatus Uhrbacteria bacterium]
MGVTIERYEELRGIGPQRLLAETLARRPNRILVKVKLIEALVRGELQLIPQRRRNERAIQARQQSEMAERGLPQVRDHMPDSGVQLIDNAREVHVGRFVNMITAECGYVLVDYAWWPHRNERGRVILQLTFEVKGTPDQLPVEADDPVVDLIEKLLGKVSHGYGHVWGNLRPTQDGGIFRLDTVNLNAVHDNKKPQHVLAFNPLTRNYWIGELSTEAATGA